MVEMQSYQRAGSVQNYSTTFVSSKSFDVNRIVRPFYAMARKSNIAEHAKGSVSYVFFYPDIYRHMRD